MKILIALPFIPLEKNSGGNQAVINMIEYLRSKCSVTLVFPVRHHNCDKADQLASMWPDVDVRPYKYWENEYHVPFFKADRQYRHSRKKLMKARGKMARSFFSHGVVSLNPADVIRDNTLLMINDGVQDSDFYFFHFIGEVAKEGFDIVQMEFFDFINIAYFLPDNIKKVLVHHELRFVRIENEVALFPDKRVEDEAMMKYVKDLELSALRHFDDIIVLTENDKQLLTPLLPGTKVHCSPAAIPESKALEFRPCGKEFVFVGAMSHNPNLDGVLWLAHSVVPELRKQLSGFKINIVGNWDKKFKKIISGACPEISFAGFVEDLGSYLNGKISIVPIRIGSGMRMKILDAINSMSPFVTTSKGVEGQNFADGKECLISDSAEDFAKAMAEIAGNETLQKEFTRAAQLKLKNMYDSAEILARRMEVYEQICKSE